jgi:hypothetical protein
MNGRIDKPRPGQTGNVHSIRNICNAQTFEQLQHPGVILCRVGCCPDEVDAVLQILDCLFLGSSTAWQAHKSEENNN